jgi:ankyrin repeat protein
MDINAEDENGITALIEACISGNQAMVEILLGSGCPAQPAGGFRHSPLRGATVCGNSHLIPILLKAGADPNAVSDGNRTPLMGACFLRKGVVKEQSVECVKALLEDERADPTISNSFGETALDLAKIRGYEDSIALIEKALSTCNRKE